MLLEIPCYNLEMLPNLPKYFIFIHPPRTGGTSIENSFKENSWEEKVAKHLPLSVYNDILSESFTFATIRNPFDILVSKYRTQWYVPLDDPTFYSKNQDNIKLSFSLWLTHYVNGNCPSYNEPSFLLSDYLDGPIDFLIRYESRTEDIINLQRTTKKLINLNFDIDLNRHDSNTSKGMHYSEYYTDSSRKIAESLVEEDLVKFNYTFDKAGK